MATTTFTTAGVNNLWSNAANWSAGIPANTDTAVIPVGQDCEYDADQSGFANGVTVQLAGTLHASTTAGSYVLKLAANMTGAGTLRAGTSGTPYPTDCTFEIQRGGFTVGPSVIDLNCSEPVIKWCNLAGVEAIGQTVLSVDTDLTSYTSHWKDGALVRICDVANGNDNQEYTIAAGGIAATTITITAGLSAQKEIGAYIVLISRNVKITHTSAAGSTAMGGNGTFTAEFRNAVNMFQNQLNSTIGGSISGCTNGLQTVYGGNVNTVIVGCNNGVNGGFGIVFSSAALVSGCSGAALTGSTGCVINCDVVGNGTGLSSSTSLIVYGDVIGNANGVNIGGGHWFVNCTLSNATNLLNTVYNYLYNVSIPVGVEFNGYNSAIMPITNFTEAIDYDAIAGQYKAWSKGGIVTKTAAVFPTGYTSSQQHACESATYYCFQNYSITIPSGGGLVVQCYVQKDALMTYLPRVWILLPGIEPFISGSPSYEAIMAADSISTWETLVLVYANATTAPVTVTVRTVAKNATGNAYFYPINTVLAPATYDVYNTLQADLDNIQTRLPAALVGGRMDSNVGAMAANTLTASALATDATTEITAAIFAGLMEGRTFEEIIKDVWAQTVGDFLADDGSDPTSITYDGPNGAVQITHTLTDTTRTVS